MTTITLYTMLLVLLLTASVIDICTMKIPNVLVAVGIFTGLYFTYVSPAVLGVRFFDLFVIFCIGYLRIIGMGDIKLWMVVCTFTSGYFSTVAIIYACVFFIVFVILKEGKPAFYRFIYFAPQVKRRRFKSLVNISDYQSYPFAPFYFLSVFVLISSSFVG